ncbi:MAG: RNA-binding S4 domain-containing protein [Oxalobacteraceae bacterium]|jgi:ribosome-associated heat shock protein Hsp15|nr:RNA-binding S4 domain-containing protein [Oxalobacteraceae bacterium]
MDGTRIDKWLWAARFFKTRSLASEAVERGRVRVNGERCKPARSLKPGELLDIDNGSTEWQVRVLALSDKRGSATVARQLYEETPEGLQRQRELAERRRLYTEPADAIQGRPTKRDRRQLDRSRS